MADSSHRQSPQNYPEDLNNIADTWLTELRAALVTVAVLVASATYTAGLSPPGGFWADDLNGHIAGTPVLRDKFPKRYTTFFYANATAFMSSLVIIVLLTMNDKKSTFRTVVLLMSMVLDVVSMMIAYAAGSARSVHTSIYVLALAVASLSLMLCFTSLLQSTYSLLSKHLGPKFARAYELTNQMVNNNQRDGPSTNTNQVVKYQNDDPSSNV